MDLFTFGFVQEEGGEIFTIKERYGTQEQGGKPSEKIKESCLGGTEEEQTQQQAGGGIIQAIGETLVEIGQTTTDLVAGQYPGGVMGQKEEGRHAE